MMGRDNVPFRHRGNATNNGRFSKGFCCFATRKTYEKTTRIMNSRQALGKQT